MTQAINTEFTKKSAGETVSAQEGWRDIEAILDHYYEFFGERAYHQVFTENQLPEDQLKKAIQSELPDEQRLTCLIMLAQIAKTRKDRDIAAFILDDRLIDDLLIEIQPDKYAPRVTAQENTGNAEERVISLFPR